MLVFQIKTSVTTRPLLSRTYLHCKRPSTSALLEMVGISANNHHHANMQAPVEQDAPACCILMCSSNTASITSRAMLA